MDAYGRDIPWIQQGHILHIKMKYWIIGYDMMWMHGLLLNIRVPQSLRVFGVGMWMRGICYTMSTLRLLHVRTDIMPANVSEFFFFLWEFIPVNLK